MTDYRAMNTTDMNLIPINHRDAVSQGDRCFLVDKGTWFVLSSDSRTWEPESVAQDLYQSITTPLAANSGEHVLVSIPIVAQTNASVIVSWNCYDGTVLHRVLGTTAIQVIRGTGSASILSEDQGADYLDSTAGTGTPWEPTAELNGNSLELKLTADPNNDTVALVTASVTVRSTADAPAATDPIIATRNALLATSPFMMFSAETGRTPSATTPGTLLTALADLTGNGHDCSVVGDLTYQADGRGKPSLRFAASGTQLVTGGVFTPYAQSHTFCFLHLLNSDIGTFIEEILLGHGGAANPFITVNYNTVGGKIQYSNSLSTTYDLATPVSGLHAIGVTIANGASNGTATVYIDKVSQGGVTIAKDANYWIEPRIGGDSLPLKSAWFYALAYWNDATDTANRLTRFSDYCAAAFGL